MVSFLADHRFFLLLGLAALLAASGPSDAAKPAPFSFPGDGYQHAKPESLDPLWIQPPKLDGGTYPSEIIQELDLESEVASDFELASPIAVTAVQWWGTYFGDPPFDPCVTGFYVRFYSDASCLPSSYIDGRHIFGNAGEFPVDPEYPNVYEYFASFYPVEIYEGKVWVSIQAKDHPYPPQWGWLETTERFDCPCAFHSDYYSYPDWLRLGEAGGEGFDAAFALYSEAGDSEACCFEDGRCINASAETCQTMGGEPQGGSTDCSPNPCPQFEACCFVDGSCFVLLETDCLDQDGSPQGEGTDCDPNPCPVPELQACCFWNGACEILIDVVCEDEHGEPMGPGSVCDPNPCPRACCLADGLCVTEDPEGCTALNGLLLDLGSCWECPCPLPAACCFALGTCRILIPTACEDAGGYSLPDQEACDPNPCPPAEESRACCFTDQSCQILSAGDCVAAGGEPRLPGIGCDPNPCPPQPAPRACCFAGGVCEIFLPDECFQAGGVPLGVCTTCDPNPCPVSDVEETPAVFETTWGSIKETFR